MRQRMRRLREWFVATADQASPLRQLQRLRHRKAMPGRGVQQGAGGGAVFVEGV